MRVGVAVTVAAATVAAVATLTACGATGAMAKPIEQVDIDSWRADLVAWPSAPNDPDMAAMYQTALTDCDHSVDDLAVRMTAPDVDPTLVLVGVSYVCPWRQATVTEAMREMHDHPAP